MVMENTHLNSRMEPDLSKNFLPSQNYFLNDRLKQRTFYESILVFTNSYEIEHFSKLGEPPNYSKCIIFKFNSEQDWGQNPFISQTIHNKWPKTVFIPCSFDYFDYRNVWYYTIFQRPLTHSWFFQFHKNISGESI